MLSSVIVPLVYVLTIFLNKMTEILENQNGFFTKATIVAKESIKFGAAIPLLIADTIAILALIARCYIALYA